MSIFLIFDAVFFITITTIITGSIGLALRYCLKSKCDDVNCCFGCFKIHRRVELEIDLEEQKEQINNEKKSPDKLKINRSFNEI